MSKQTHSDDAGRDGMKTCPKCWGKKEVHTTSPYFPDGWMGWLMCPVCEGEGVVPLEDGK